MKTMPIRFALPLAAAIAAMGLSGCETIGNPIEVLTGEREGPDEFQVLARKPLRMPGSLALPEPRLGEPSPLEPDPQTDAVIALLGAPVAVTSAPGGSGERALIEAATSGTGGVDSRAIEQIESEADANKPYEPPLLTDLFKEENSPGTGDSLDPAAEARRLQTEGVAPAPIDPNDRNIPRPGSDEEGFVFRIFSED